MKQVAFLYKDVKYVTVIGVDDFIRTVLPSDTCNAVDSFKIIASRGVAAQFKKLYGVDVQHVPVLDEGCTVDKRGDIFIVSGTFTDATGQHTVAISSDKILIDGVDQSEEPAPTPVAEEPKAEPVVEEPKQEPAPVAEEPVIWETFDEKPEPEPEPAVEEPEPESVVEEPAVEEPEPVAEDQEPEPSLEEEPEIDGMIVPESVNIARAIAEGVAEGVSVEVPVVTVPDAQALKLERLVPRGQGFAMASRRTQASSITIGTKSARPGFSMHNSSKPQAPKMPKSFMTGKMRAKLEAQGVTKFAAGAPLPIRCTPAEPAEEKVGEFLCVGEPTEPMQPDIMDKTQQSLMKASVRAMLSSEANAVIGDIPHALLTSFPEFTSEAPDVNAIRTEGVNYCIKNHWHKCGNWFATDYIENGMRCFYNVRRDIYVEIETATCKKWYKAVKG